MSIKVKQQVLDHNGRMPTSGASKPGRTARKKFKRSHSSGMHRRRNKKIEW